MSKLATTLTQFRDLPDEELRQALTRTRDELFRLQLGQYTNQVSSTAGMVTKRRDIARIMTVLRGRQLGHETQGQKAKAAAKTEATASTPKAAKKSAAPKAAKTEKKTKAKS
jgi:large subunit ribosomal protein L29